MGNDDPVPDIQPEGSSVSNLPEDTAPLVSNANQYFAYALTMVGVFIYYRVAWKAAEAIFFENSAFLKSYSSFFFYMWLVPIVGLISSIVNPSLTGTASWTSSILIVGSIPLSACFLYVLLFGIPKMPTPAAA
jgi:hypothetical protein